MAMQRQASLYQAGSIVEESLLSLSPQERENAAISHRQSSGCCPRFFIFFGPNSIFKHTYLLTVAARGGIKLRMFDCLVWMSPDLMTQHERIRCREARSVLRVPHSHLHTAQTPVRVEGGPCPCRSCWIPSRAGTTEALLWPTFRVLGPRDKRRGHP